jgi:2-C-methyl-D-erythritol 4-phosphate cytidylyltransferase
MSESALFTVTSADFRPRCFALVPCAGVGERAGVGGPKQYHQVAGQAVVAHTLKALQRVSRVDATLVVLSPGDERFEHCAPDFVGEGAWVARVGGATRAESVLNGLAELSARGAQPHDWVMVHDAARCLLRPEWVDRLLDACADDEVGGLLALPLADTLKVAVPGPSDEPRASATVDRTAKWAAQTPQVFRLGLLQPALAGALSDPAKAAAVTDEASAIEMLGHAPRLVTGDFENIKLTWPGDFALAQRLLATRS